MYQKVSKTIWSEFHKMFVVILLSFVQEKNYKEIFAPLFSTQRARPNVAFWLVYLSHGFFVVTSIGFSIYFLLKKTCLIEETARGKKKLNAEFGFIYL